MLNYSWLYIRQEYLHPKYAKYRNAKKFLLD